MLLLFSCEKFCQPVTVYAVYNGNYSVQHNNHWNRCKLQVNSAKKAMGQAEQDPELALW